MKINVQVSNEVVDLGYGYTFKTGKYEVDPVKITRRPCGIGAAAKRYYYVVHFIGFDDMLNIHKQSLAGKETHENIMRKQNKQFNPSLLNFVNNTALF